MMSIKLLAPAAAALAMAVALAVAIAMAEAVIAPRGTFAADTPAQPASPDLRTMAAASDGEDKGAALEAAVLLELQRDGYSGN